MWDTMLLSLITSLFVLLSAAAPVTENPALSHTLAKRSIQCTSMFGYGILYPDCDAAIENMQKLPQFKPDRGEGIFDNPRSEFSRTASDSRFRLPQSFTVHTCTIFIDLASHLNSMVFVRSNVASGAQRLVSQCVRPSFTGGSDTGSGIDTVIGRESNLDPSLRRGWEQCKALMRNNNPFDEDIQCLLHQFEVDAEAQARQRAGLPGNHDTSKR